ncbi:response regulator [Aridibaculum aurantiacum]|uniref:response regulator n=1 Tax=Aridibaculum aurantiacum TaxID=2810307 RepID=UPI001A9782D5|nr:response regulator [Aridibaculum aurantiacum]
MIFNKKSHILVAEDDEDDFLFFKDALVKTTRATISNVRNGVQLLEYLDTNPKPDLIFLDLNIPRKSGKQCLKTLWETHYIDSVPIVIYSTSRNEEDIEECYNFGARFYMIKPTSYGSLLNLLNRLFGQLSHDPREFIRREEFLIREAK